jgi:hypothetical protein
MVNYNIYISKYVIWMKFKYCLNFEAPLSQSKMIIAANIMLIEQQNNSNQLICHVQEYVVQEHI